MQSNLAISFPERSQPQVALAQALARKPEVPLPTVAGVDGLVASLSNLVEEEKPACSVCISLQVAGEIVQVLCTSVAPLIETLGFSFGATYAELPEELQCAAIASALQPLMNSVSAWCGQPVSLAGLSVSSEEREAANVETCSLGWSIRSDDGVVLGTGSVEMPEAGVVATTLLHSLLAVVPQSTPKELFALLRCVVGKMQLTAQEVSALQTGDVLLGHFAHDVEEQNKFGLYVHSMQIGSAVRVENGFLVTAIAGYGDELEKQDVVENCMSEAVQQNEVLVEQDVEEHSSQEATVDVSALELDVFFEVANTKMTLEELSAVGEGYVFVTDTAIDAPVTVRAGNKEIGKGRLVRVADRVGVELLSVAG